MILTEGSDNVGSAGKIGRYVRISCLASPSTCRRKARRIPDEAQLRDHDLITRGT